MESAHALAVNKEFDLLFHVSSEGELEQAAFLIQYFLKENKKILVLFTSPSVLPKLERLAKANTNLYIAALPLVGGFAPIKELKFKMFFMVRYDFFPHLLALADDKENYSVLLSATMKNKASFFSGAYHLACLEHFDFLVAATSKDTGKFQEVGFESKAFEFRVPQIANRLESSGALLDKQSLLLYQKFIETFPRTKRIIVGSAWEEDLAFFKDEAFVKDIKEGRVVVSIAPHKLDGLFVQKIKDTILENCHGALKLTLLAEDTDEIERGTVIICLLKGVLLESYSWFGHVYVGGGFSRSVHSVLEPFWSGAWLYCGPKTHRSTEVDFVMEKRPDRLYVLESAGDLEHIYQIIQNRDGEFSDEQRYLPEYTIAAGELAHEFSKRLEC